VGTILDKKVWAEEFLKQGLGNLNPTSNTIHFVQAWEIHESGAGAVVGCDHNPLNCGWNWPGATQCNAIVKKYAAYLDGIRATAANLHNGLYPSLTHALATNDENNLGFNGHKMAANIAGDLEVWVSGNREGHLDYVNAILALAGQPSLPSGGDVGQVTPAGVPDTNPLGSAGSLLDTLNSLVNNPTRLAKGLIGIVLLLVGLALMIKQLVPPGVQKAALAAVGA